VGLIARAIETAGIPTVSISITKDLTESVGVPRAVFVKWPLGHPLGEPQNAAQQRTLIFDALSLLETERLRDTEIIEIQRLRDWVRRDAIS
jgi:D-proline reductase (dithiol) PrdB